MKLLPEQSTPTGRRPKSMCGRTSKHSAVSGGAKFPDARCLRCKHRTNTHVVHRARTARESRTPSHTYAHCASRARRGILQDTAQIRTLRIAHTRQGNLAHHRTHTRIAHRVHAAGEILHIIAQIRTLYSAAHAPGESYKTSHKCTHYASRTRGRGKSCTLSHVTAAGTNIDLMTVTHNDRGNGWCSERALKGARMLQPFWHRPSVRTPVGTALLFTSRVLCAGVAVVLCAGSTSIQVRIHTFCSNKIVGAKPNDAACA